MTTKNTAEPLLDLRPQREGELFESHLQTGLQRLAYDVLTRTGYLDCGPNDMRGSIAIFTAIDPEVLQIISEDVVYRRKPGGEWGAFNIKRQFRNEQRINLKPVTRQVAA